MSSSAQQDSTPPLDFLLLQYKKVRRRSLQLAEPLSEEDCCAQSMPDASPIKWHLAHTTWFFETFLLERLEPDFQPFHPMFRVLFNSYYNGVGEKHPRPQRGLLTRPSLREVHAYRRNVDARIELLLRRALPNEQAELLVLGLQHEQQHQELMLTDLKHLLSMNPLHPAYADTVLEESKAAPAMNWLEFDAALVEIGHAGQGFCFDNELPRHRQFVEPFALAARLVTNGEYLAFIEAGGYQNPALWLSEGWDWVRSQGITQPLYWHRPQQQEGWREFTLHGLQALDLQRLVAHLSLYEADAYAHWRGARLPTEAEWEHAAAVADSSTDGKQLAQLFGACWQWTSSSYAPYPGFTIADGALGEYNGKFMLNQYVLRGSSSATPDGHARTTYRNFFPASARWQFTGIRLAKSLSSGMHLFDPPAK